MAMLGIGLITVILGLTLGGSPEQARREKRDEQRTQQISSIRNEIDQFYSVNRRLPRQDEFDSLYRSAIRNYGYGIAAGTLEPPTYITTGPSTYETCVTFETDRDSKNANVRPAYLNGKYLYPESDYPDTYTHPEGKTCYAVRISGYALNQVQPIAQPVQPVPAAPIPPGSVPFAPAP